MICLEEYKNMSNDEIIKSCKSSIDKVLDSFDYALLTDDEINRVLNDSITSGMSVITVSACKDLENYIAKRVKASFNSYVLGTIYKDDDRVKSILLNYFSKVKKVKGVKDAKSRIKALSTYLNKIRLMPSIDVYITLFNECELFKNCLDLIYKHYEKLIKDGDAYKLFDDRELEIILAYCTVNNIDINSSLLESKIDEDKKIDDSYKFYRDEIGKIPLLSADEEKELATKILEGRLAKTKLDNKDFNSDELSYLERQVKIGELSRQKLIEHNLRLVVSVADRYTIYGHDPLDLTQNGNEGLTKGVDKYDVTLGYRFSTYALYWIRQGITRGIYNDSRTIRIPIHAQETKAHLLKVYDVLEQELKRTPTISELSDKTGVSEDDINILLTRTSGTASLNDTLKSDKSDRSAELIDVIASDESIEDNEMEDSFKITFLEAFEKTNLTSREREVIIRRFGLYDHEEETLEQVGTSLNVTRERIRQIEKKALKKLYNNSGIRNCGSFINADIRKKDISKPTSASNYGTYKKNYNRILATRKTVYELVGCDSRITDLVSEQILDSYDWSILEKRNGSRDLSITGDTPLSMEENGIFKSIINRLKRTTKEYIKYKNNKPIKELYDLVNKDAYNKLREFIDEDYTILICLFEGYNTKSKKYSANEIALLLNVDVNIIKIEIKEALKELKNNFSKGFNL